jgi:hypothetical protein
MLWTVGGFRRTLTSLETGRALKICSAGLHLGVAWARMGPVMTLGSPLVSPEFAGLEFAGESPAIARRATLERPGNRLSWAGPRKMSEPCKPGFLFHGRSIEIRASTRT